MVDIENIKHKKKSKRRSVYRKGYMRSKRKILSLRAVRENKKPKVSGSRSGSRRKV